MKFTFWFAVLIVTALAACIVSSAIAEDLKSVIPSDNDQGTIPPLSPTATYPYKVKSVIWYKDGIQQPPIVFQYDGQSANIAIRTGETIMFKVKCYYSGPGKGYMFFRDDETKYQESMFLKSGATSTKYVMRSFMWTTTGNHVLWVDAFGPNIRWGDGLSDDHNLYVTVT